MKLKFIAAAALAVCSGSVLAAAAPVTCNTTNTSASKEAIIVNTCAPEVTVYVAGSSALGGAIATTVLSVFDTGTVAFAPIKINDASGAGLSKGSDVAYYGIRGTKRTLIIYNPTNGSAAGVSQVLVAPKAPKLPSLDGVAVATNIPEARVVHVGPVNATTPNTCTSNSAATTSAIAVVDCSMLFDRQADLAISDVAAKELYAVYTQAAKAKLTDLAATPLGMQGFGVTVNWKMYQALQTAQITAGTLPSTCVAGATTADCQPSIRSVDYSSLVTNKKDFGPAKNGALFGLDSSTPLLLARRDIYSGTQATSNMYFANGACGVIPAKSTNIGGALPLTTATDFPATYTATSTAATATIPAGGFGVVELLVGDHVKWLQKYVTDAYVIGVVNVKARAVVANDYNFVKLDGISPNFVGLTSATKGRAGWVDGTYPIAVTSYAMTMTPVFTKASAEKKELITLLIDKMKDPVNNLDGIAYLTGGTDTTAAYMARAVRGFDGNNCSPLVRK